METLDLFNIMKAKFWYFPQSNNPLTQHSRLLGQLTNLNGTPFNTDNFLYVDDGAFIFQTREDIQSASQAIYNHCAWFNLQMHVGNSRKKSKTEVKYFPASLHEAENSCKNQNKTPKDLILNNGINIIPFTKKFTYLGFIITPILNENTKTKPELKKKLHKWASWGISSHARMLTLE